MRSHSRRDAGKHQNHCNRDAGAGCFQYQLSSLPGWRLSISEQRFHLIHERVYTAAISQLVDTRTWRLQGLRELSQGSFKPPESADQIPKRKRFEGEIDAINKT